MLVGLSFVLYCLNFNVSDSDSAHQFRLLLIPCWPPRFILFFFIAKENGVMWLAVADSTGGATTTG